MLSERGASYFQRQILYHGREAQRDLEFAVPAGGYQNQVSGISHHPIDSRSGDLHIHENEMITDYSIVPRGTTEMQDN